MSVTASTEERRKNHELRAIVHFFAKSALDSNQSAWSCIQDIYTSIDVILRQSSDLSVSQELLDAFETNRKVIEEIYKPNALPETRHLAGPLSDYFTKFLAMVNIGQKRREPELPSEDIETLQQRIDEFLRSYVINWIKDDRVTFLLLITIIHRRIQHLTTPALKDAIAGLIEIFRSREAGYDRALALLIYNLCHSSVEAINEADLFHASQYCERAVELFKMLSPDSKVKESLRAQIDDAMRITTERLVNRIQEYPQEEQIQHIETIVKKLINMEMIAYLLPQLVFFLIRAQRYEDCIHHLDDILTAKLDKQFLDYQTAITIGFEWCDSLLKAERYSRGQVDFSYIDREKDNIKNVYEFIKDVKVPILEDETFYNVEVEKLAVTLSHLGTLFFQFGNIQMAAEAYGTSFDTILMKKCSRNRNSVDEILDRYKDMIHHPLNAAPLEAHPLIGVFASEKGFDVLKENQLQKLEADGEQTEERTITFESLDHIQKELISDLMDATKNKLARPFSENFSAYKPFIEDKYRAVKSRMQI